MDRLDKLAAALPEGMDGALVTSPVNRRYYTGLASSAGTLLLTRKERWFFIDSRYYEVASNQIQNCKVVLQKKLMEQLQEVMEEQKIQVLGLESDGVTVRSFLSYQKEFPNRTFLMDNQLSDAISRQRQIKSQEELNWIQKAQDMADKTFTHILQFIQPGMTEWEIAGEMEFYSRSLGSEEPAFGFIVVSGENSSKPHGVPSLRKVQKGDLITLDFGCTAGGYRSDMTRTIGVGPLSQEQIQVYETVLEAQEAALAAIKPGMICRDVDKIARDIIETKYNGIYKGLFGHGLGHGLGLEVHEPPLAFNPLCDMVLEPGMVLSVEPGIYLPGKFGVRIEDIIAVTETGLYNFAASPKEPILL